MNTVIKSVCFRILVCTFILSVITPNLHAAPANCAGLLKKYFDTVSSNNRMTPMLVMAQTELWKKHPHGKSFNGHMEQWGAFKAAAPNRYLQFVKGKTSFSDRNAFNGKKDETSVYITENGVVKIVLNTWGNTEARLTVTSCNAMPDANNLLVQAVQGGVRSRNTAYSFSLFTVETLL